MLLRILAGVIGAMLLAAPMVALADGSSGDKTADEIIAAAKKAGENAVKLAELIKAADQSAAEKMVGQDINIGGIPTTRSKESWTMRSPQGITVVATKLQGENNPDVKLEENSVCMWGKLKSVDVRNKSITLENVELIYVEWMPELHKDDK